MPRIAPQAGVQHLALVRRIALERGQLGVADALEHDPDHRQHRPDPGYNAQARLSLHLTHLHRQRRQPGQHGLGQKHEQQGRLGERPALVAFLILDDLHIPPIRPAGPPAPEQMPAQPQRPDRAQPDQQRLARRIAVGARQGRHRQQQHAQRPDRIDETDVLQLQRDQPQAEHHGDDQGQVQSQQEENVDQGHEPDTAAGRMWIAPARTPLNTLLHSP